MHSKIKSLVMAALMAAMACVATMVIKIPTPMKGYLNLGDCIVLLSGGSWYPGTASWRQDLGLPLRMFFRVT